MAENDLQVQVILNTYKKLQSIKETTEQVKKMFPETTETYVMEIINRASTVVKSDDDESKWSKKPAEKKSAKILQADAFSGLIAFHSKLRKIETTLIEPNKTVPEELRKEIRELLLHFFNVIKELN